MKNIYLLSVLVLSLMFSGCGDDEDGIAPPSVPPPATPPPATPPPTTPDNVAPQVKINSPHNDDTYLAIGIVLIYAWAKDNNDIKGMKMFLADPSGTRKPIEIIDNGRVDDGTGEYITQLLRPGGSVSGQYALIVEAEDFNKNVTSDSVQLNIIAEDLSEIDFKIAFTSTGWYQYMGGIGRELDLNGFNLAFHSMINKNQWDYSIDPTYVNEFGEDFGGHTKLWDKWDVNKNEYLEYSELEKGMEDLKFFTDWDVNNNGSISEEELADGVGALWDVNKDNVVTAAEFERKLLKYFL